MTTRDIPSDQAQAPVQLERREGHVAVVTLNRPEARNAVNPELALALSGIVDEIERDPDIWIAVLRGAGSVFCAGADLKAVAAGRGPELFPAPHGFAGFVYAERSKPWIAAVTGAALAGGCEIALACDLIVAAENSSFGLPEVKRGLVAAAGGMYRLPRALPRNLAIETILTGEPISAIRAHHHGMVNQLAAPDHVVTEAIALAARIVRNAPIAVRESLRVARAAADLTEAELRELSRQGRDRIAATEDYKEGPRAFIEKREPRWLGR
jgi:enoyl-CoA hydratase/carnithine racemase